jgi:hypothetical protein
MAVSYSPDRQLNAAVLRYVGVSSANAPRLVDGYSGPQASLERVVPFQLLLQRRWRHVGRDITDKLTCGGVIGRKKSV